MSEWPAGRDRWATILVELLSISPILEAYLFIKRNAGDFVGGGRFPVCGHNIDGDGPIG